MGGGVPAGEVAGEFCPAVAELFVVEGECLFLLGRPLVVADAVVEVVVVAFAALLAVPAADVELALHDAGDLRPPLHVLLLVEVLQDAVLLHRPITTI